MDKDMNERLQGGNDGRNDYRIPGIAGGRDTQEGTASHLPPGAATGTGISADRTSYSNHGLPEDPQKANGDPGDGAD